MPGGVGGTDIYKVVRTRDGNWGKPFNLGDKINTSRDEMFPFIHSTGLLFFASDGHIGLGGRDIFFCSFEKDVPGEIVNMSSPINGPKDDFAIIMDEDLKKGYLSSFI